jgi:hypothetical protein
MSNKRCPGPKNCRVRKCGTDECPLRKETLLDKIKKIFKKRA